MLHLEICATLQFYCNLGYFKFSSILGKQEKMGKGFYSRFLWNCVFLFFGLCPSICLSVCLSVPCHNQLVIFTARNVTTYLRMIYIKITHALKDSTSIVFYCLPFELSDCLTVWLSNCLFCYFFRTLRTESVERRHLRSRYAVRPPLRVVDARGHYSGHHSGNNDRNLLHNILLH